MTLPQTILIEPVTGATLEIFALQHLGGDEAHTCYLMSFKPDAKFKQFGTLDDMAFLLKNNSHAMTMKAIKGSKLIQITAPYFSGICLQKISELDFIELKETINTIAALNVFGGRLNVSTGEFKQWEMPKPQEDITIS